jgi:hypothetical protein
MLGAFALRMAEKKKRAHQTEACRNIKKLSTAAVSTSWALEEQRVHFLGFNYNFRRYL